ncbi:hypothetical protein MTOK_50320 [Mycolicibacterium tokaiense]|nr:hypothetical protein MTOK_50320 [Mycolicibacterium tokaiense]
MLRYVSQFGDAVADMHHLCLQLVQFAKKLVDLLPVTKAGGSQVRCAAAGRRRAARGVALREPDAGTLHG